jgi:outer membrane protein
LAEASVDLAAAMHWPQITLSAGGVALASRGQVYADGLVSPASQETFFAGQAGLNLRWVLYDFGRTSSAVDAANAGARAAKLSARVTEQVAMAEAATAFFTVLANDDLVRSADAVRANRERILTVSRSLTKEGFRGTVDTARAQVALDVARLDLYLATAASENDSVLLATALQLDPSTTFRLAAPEPLRRDDSTLTSDGGTEAIGRRRDVAAAEARVGEARDRLEAASRAWLPVLEATGSGQMTYAHASSVFVGTGSGPVVVDGPTESVQGTLMVTVPLFDATLNANVRAARAALDESRAYLDQVEYSARREFLQSARQLTNARVVLEQSERLAAGAAANLAAVEDRYTSGIDGPLVLADAEREDASARVAIIRARLEQNLAGVRWLASLSRMDDLLGAR